MSCLLIDFDSRLDSFDDLPGQALFEHRWEADFCVGELRTLEPGAEVYLLDSVSKAHEIHIVAHGTLVAARQDDRLNSVADYGDVSGAYCRAASLELTSGYPDCLVVRVRLASVVTFDYALSVDGSDYGVSAPLVCGERLLQPACDALRTEWDQHVQDAMSNGDGGYAG